MRTVRVFATRYRTSTVPAQLHYPHMPLQVSLLRRWLAGGAILVIAVVAGAYFIAKWRIHSALKEIPEKIGIEVQQSAQGFTISKSEAGRTIFKVQASKAVQYKQGEHATLHDVNITLYGPDSKRFDQIYGSDFDYDMKSGDITAKGDVQIELEANPEGLAHPDQAVPAELKNPIHVETSGLTFNQKTGNAYTKEKVEFTLPQARGSATGASYEAKTNTLTLLSDVNLSVEGANSAKVSAVRAVVTKEPRVLLFQQAHGQAGSRRFEADEVKLYLRANNSVDRILASGQVQVKSSADPPSQVQADQLELQLAQNTPSLQTAVFSGDVRWETAEAQVMRGKCQRAVLDFAARNLLRKVHTEGDVQIEQAQMKKAQAEKPLVSASEANQPQDLELTAAAVDFFVGAGRYLQRAETSGPAQITIHGGGVDSVTASSNQQTNRANNETVVTAGQFEAKLNQQGQIAALHGAPQARMVNKSPGQPDRTSTSDALDVTFRSGGGVDSITQQGNVAYNDGTLQAWGNLARYAVSDRVLTLTGSPRIVEAGMTTTAGRVRVNRASGDAIAEGNVKTSYNDLKPQPNGALLATSDPVHVTAHSMTANRSTGMATYQGNARLWQNANVVQAPIIAFDRNHRSLIASSSGTQQVSTVLTLAEKSPRDGSPAGKNAASAPLAITSSQLTYVDAEREAHFGGNVVAKTADATITAAQADVFLQPASQTGAKESLTGAGRLERIIAQGHVVLTEPKRRAIGDELTYTASDDKFVLTGGPPCIFDAEHGKITGVSLTFFRHDDTVLVDGNTANPAVTQTRLAR